MTERKCSMPFMQNNSKKQYDSNSPGIYDGQPCYIVI